LRDAAFQGNSAIVSLLLQDRRADPAAADSKGGSACLRGAAKVYATKQSARFAAIVNLLLEDGRADPAVMSVAPPVTPP
jgi:hypothetical protein